MRMTVGRLVKVRVILENPIAGVYEMNDFIERLQPVAELSHLSSKNQVLSLNVGVKLRGDIDACEDLVIVVGEIRNLGHQIIQVLLFTHSRATCRFPIG